MVRVGNDDPTPPCHVRPEDGPVLCVLVLMPAKSVSSQVSQGPDQRLSRMPGNGTQAAAVRRVCQCMVVGCKEIPSSSDRVTGSRARDRVQHPCWRSGEDA